MQSKDMVINMTKSKRNKIVGLSCMGAALVIAIIGIIFIFNFSKPAETNKTLSISVVHGDESVKDFTVQTVRANLADALVDEKIAEGSDSEYGLFITTVDGETADDSKEQWWCITKGGEQLNTGVTDTITADGDKYEITLTTGY